MLTTAERLRIEIADLDKQIAANDKAIEEAERRQDGRRKQGDNLYRRRLTAEAELERETAPMVKPQPKGVTCDGWNI